MQPFPKIEQLHNLLKYIRHRKENSPDFLNDEELDFHGTVKLHGTNAAVGFNRARGLWCQSRTTIIDVARDNMKFAAFVNSNDAIFSGMIIELAETCNIDLTKNSVIIFGEWCGSGIQRDMAINSLPRMFVIFGVKIQNNSTEAKEDEELERVLVEGVPAVGSYWLDLRRLDSHLLSKPEKNIFNILTFPTYNVKISLSDPEASVSLLTELTMAVVKECPVGKALGALGAGEGIVWIHVTGTSSTSSASSTSSELNFIENIWGWLKAYHRSNCTYNVRDLCEGLPNTMENVDRASCERVSR